MFTGIIEGIGRVQGVRHLKDHTQLAVRASFSLREAKLGDSIAVDGVCLTVTRKQGAVFYADVSPETLACTTLGDLKVGDRLNLERPLRLMDRLGGHLVQGHVDGVGLISKKQIVRSAGESYYRVEVQVPKHLQIAMVEKGSVAVDGISLTINETLRDRIALCIIPHTQSRTTLTEKKIGDKVNLEADILLKYLEKMLNNAKVLSGKGQRR